MGGVRAGGTRIWVVATTRGRKVAGGDEGRRSLVFANRWSVVGKGREGAMWDGSSPLVVGSCGQEVLSVAFSRRGIVQISLCFGNHFVVGDMLRKN